MIFDDMHSKVGFLTGAYLLHHVANNPWKSAFILSGGLLGAKYMSTKSVYKDMEKSLLNNATEDIAMEVGEQTRLIKSFVLHMLHPIVNFTGIKGFVYAVLSFLTDIGLLSLTCFSAAAALVTTILSGPISFFQQPTISQPPSVVIGHLEQEKQFSCASELLTLIFQSLTLVAGITAARPHNMTNWAKTLLQGINMIGPKTGGLIAFFNNLLSVCKSMFDYISNLLYKRTVLENVALDSPQILEEWCREVNFLCDPRNEFKVLNNMKWLCRVETCVDIGARLMEELVSKKDKTTNMNVLMQMFHSIKRVRDKALSWTAGVSFRREPFCIWINGPVGIGKSQMAVDLALNMLKAADIPIESDPCYVIQPGTKHWTGCQGKSVVIYDDFLSSGDSTSLCEEISSFMTLKSCSLFVPEQADIPDKGRPYAPELIIVNSNTAFPNVPEIHNELAFTRRRDFMVDVDLVHDIKKQGFDKISEVKAKDALQEFRDKLDSGISDDLKHYYHLTFGKYSRVSDNTEHPRLVYNYPEFLSMAQNAFKAFKSDQESLYKRKLAKIFDNIDPGDVKSPLEDYILNTPKDSSLLCKLTGHPKLLVDKILDQCYASYSNLMKNISSTGLEESVSETISQVLGHCESEQQDDSVSAENFDDIKIKESYPLTIVVPSKGFKCSDTCHGCASTATLTEYRNRCVHVQAAPKTFDLCYYDQDMTGLENSELSYTTNGSFKIDNEQYPLYCGPHCIMYNPKIIQCLVERKKISSDFVKILDFNYIKGSRLDLDIKEVVEQLKPKVGFVSKAFEALRRAFRWLVNNAIVLHVIALIGFKFWERYRANKQVETQQQDSLIFDIDGKGDLLPLRPVSETPASHIASSGDVKMQRRIAAAKRGVTRKVLEGHMSTDDIRPLIERNMCFFKMDYKLKNQEVRKVRQFKGLGICGRSVLILKHFIDDLDLFEDIKVTVMAHSMETAVELNWSSIQVLRYQKSEISVLCLPSNGITLFRDLRKHFIPQEIFESGCISRQALMLRPLVNGVTELIHLNISIGGAISVASPNTGGISSTIPESIRYTWGEQGDCMSLLLTKGDRPYIIGFHIAGEKGWGIAEPCMMEDFISLDNLGGMKFEEIPDKLIGQSQPSVEIDSNVVFEGVSNFFHPQATKSAIIPSKISQFIDRDSYSIQSPLTRKDVDHKFDPLIEGVRLHGYPPMGFPVEELSICLNDYKNLIIMNCKPQLTSVGIRTIAESVCGLPGRDGYKSMELSTSEGFPYIKERPRGQSDKHWLVKRHLDEETAHLVFDSLDDRVISIMNHKENLRKQNIIPVSVFIDCLKDCRIPKSKKYVPGKTRIFSISPTDFTIQFRQYFMDFMASYKVCRLNCEHAIGIAVQGIEWTMLLQKISNNGQYTKFLCGDYSKFGPTLDPEIVRGLFKIYTEWYSQNGDNNTDNAQIRTIMGEELINCLHLCGNVFYRVLCGSPSGAPITAPLNSGVNSVYMRLAWRECWKNDPSMRTFTAMREHICFYSYGDDFVAGISDVAVEKFNNKFLQDYFASFGIKYTDAQKSSGEIRPYCALGDVSFLKHQFLPHPKLSGRFLAALDKNSVLDCPLWIHKSFDDEEATLINCETSLLLAYGHGKPFYNSILSSFRKIYKDIVDLPRLPRFYEWDELDDIIWFKSNSTCPKDLEAEYVRLQTLYENYVNKLCLLTEDP